MPRIPILLVGLLLSVSWVEVVGQQNPANRSLKRTIIFRADQDAIRGQIVRIDEVSLTVLTAEREVTIPLTDIRRMIVTVERSAGRGPILGAALVGYASAYLFMTSHGSGGFVTTENAGFLVLIPSIGVGAALGYLLEQGPTQTDLIFDFTGDEEEKSREWARVKKIGKDDPRSGTVHITLQGSHVNSNQPRLTVPSASEYYPGYNASEFNLLRRAQVTYSLASYFEVGLAVIWFGEPPQTSNGFVLMTNGDSRSYSASQSFDASGTCIVAAFRPLDHFSGSHVDLAVGGGIGSASVEYRRTTTLWIYPAGAMSSTQNSNVHIPDDVVFGYLFAHCAIEIVDGFSLGMVIDQVLGPSTELPAAPGVNIPAHTLRFGNSSFGFIMSFHF